jgi:large subunit ribosomal protein L29
MKSKEYKALSAEDLRKKLTESRQNLFNLRFRHATKQLDNTAGIPAAKREVACILTILGQKEKGA